MKNKTIIVLGANGMLGRYVISYLKLKKYNVIGLTRENIDLSDFKNNEFLNYINQLFGDINEKIIINCAGAIVQKLNDYGVEKMIEINSLFPWKLSKICDENAIKLIHVTTDCVFSGLKGMYNENDIHDSVDIYGKSKSLGEPSYGTIIRTSIIGEELEGKKSFIEWVKSEKNNKVNGYKRNIWNGITCLEFAKICDKIIKDNKYWNGVRHIHSPDYLNKGDMIKMVSKIFKLNIDVNMVDEPIRLCDRTISSNYNLSEYNIPTIENQIIELKKFKLLTNDNFTQS